MFYLGYNVGTFLFAVETILSPTSPIGNTLVENANR